MEEKQIYNCLILGAGPSGYTAGIYAARASMSPVIYTGPQPGGQLTITTDVENYPGYPEGVQGPEMMEDFRKQAERFGTEVKYEVIEKVDFSGPVHKLWTTGGQEIHAHSVIISTGASARWLGLPSEERLMNKGVSACAVCDGFFFRGHEMVVVGGGDSAAEEAMYLSKISPKVHLLVRRDEMRASQIMQDRVKNAENIEIHWNTVIDEILGEEEVEAVRLLNRQTNEKTVLPVKAVFVAIGHLPNTQPFKGWIDMDAQGYIVTKPGTTLTNVEGVFAAGDCQDRIYRQAITAAGSGAMAALDAERYLSEKGII